MVAKRTLYAFFTLLVTLSGLVAYDGAAQNESVKDINVSIKLQNASLQDAIDDIESQTSFSFTYEEKDLLARNGITVKAKNQALDLVLLKIAKDADVEFLQVNRNIHVKARELNVKVEEVVNLSQARNVTGTVTSSEDQSALPGVNVIIKGANEGTTTDIDGKFTLEVPGASSILVFSSVDILSIIPFSLSSRIRRKCSSILSLSAIKFGVLPESDICSKLDSSSVAALSFSNPNLNGATLT